VDPTSWAVASKINDPTQFDAFAAASTKHASAFFEAPKQVTLSNFGQCSAFCGRQHFLLE
jgi:hypothetical protein